MAACNATFVVAALVVGVLAVPSGVASTKELQDSNASESVNDLPIVVNWARPILRHGSRTPFVEFPIQRPKRRPAQLDTNRGNFLPQQIDMAQLQAPLRRPDPSSVLETLDGRQKTKSDEPFFKIFDFSPTTTPNLSFESLQTPEEDFFSQPIWELAELLDREREVGLGDEAENLGQFMFDRPVKRPVDLMDVNCLAEAVYFEARGEIPKGRIAVAETIMNRVESKDFPDTVCGVVQQGMELRHRCQFSYKCDGLAETITEQEVFAEIKQLAHRMMSDGNSKLTDGATHFHTLDVNPRWDSSLKRTTTIGQHLFYR